MWDNTEPMKYPRGGKLLMATAGGIRTSVARDALKAGADILVVGRALLRRKPWRVLL